MYTFVGVLSTSSDTEGGILKPCGDLLSLSRASCFLRIGHMASSPMVMKTTFMVTNKRLSVIEKEMKEWRKEMEERRK